MLPIENGALSQQSVEIHSLKEFVGDDETVNAVDAKFNPEILRHPAIVSSPMQNSVDVVFGDTKKNSIHKVNASPDRGCTVCTSRSASWWRTAGGGRPLNSSRPPASPLSGRDRSRVIERGDRLVFANATDKALNYLTYSDGTWSDASRSRLSSKLPAETALAAVDKMVSSQ